MAKQSKFEKGSQVRFALTDNGPFEVIEILKNELKVKSSSGNVFSCKKSLFEVLEE